MIEQQVILMCPPEYFGVDYIINPWMEGNRGNTKKAQALESWIKLQKAIAQYTTTILMEPIKGLPDLVFTANAGFVLDGQVIVSRFRTKERQQEEPYFHRWFKEYGLTVLKWPSTIAFEGAGDALLDRDQPLIWLGYGFRTDEAAAPLLQNLFKRTVVPLRLVDARFYHLDTCFCPLSDGFLMYYPKAFDEESQTRILENTNDAKRIIIQDEDACSFSCNAVEINKTLLMNKASPRLTQTLKDRGFITHITPLEEFMKAGGAAKCLTLKLIEH